MDFYFLYLILLGFWPPLLWPALRTKGGLRLWLLLLIALGLAVSVYEARLWLRPAEPIRIDVLFGAPVLAGLFALTALLLFLAGWRRFATVYGLAILILCGAATFAWQEMEREQERFVEGRALIARAGFRSPEAYEDRFGPFTPAVQGLPVGHWQPEDETFASFASRLVINGQGRLWLFRSYREAETLELTSGTEVLRREEGDGSTWTVELQRYSSAYPGARVAVAHQEPGRLTLSMERSSAVFTKTPPPVEAAPEQQNLRYLGSFGSIACDGRRLDLAQVWLWRDQERLYAVGVVRAFSQSQPEGFATPVVFGSAQERDGAWHFAWEGVRGPSQARVTLGEGQVIMTIKQGTWPEQQFDMAQDKGFLSGDLVDLAPLTTVEDWRHWFSVVSLGNRVTGETPACE